MKKQKNVNSKSIYSYIHCSTEKNQEMEATKVHVNEKIMRLRHIYEIYMKWNTAPLKENKLLPCSILLTLEKFKFKVESNSAAVGHLL